LSARARQAGALPVAAPDAAPPSCRSD
jgi:hypothetical protein